MLTPYVRGTPLPEHLAPLFRRFNPSEKQLASGANPWVDVHIDPDPDAIVIATGIDVAGRKIRLYSPEHHAQAKAGKFERVRSLLIEWEDIRTQIEGDINESTTLRTREAALVAYLIYETGVRPGSETDTRAKVQAYGATTLQLRHVKPCTRGVRLKFIGKKGVSQNILVTNPHLVGVFLRRKAASRVWSLPLFSVNASSLREYFKTLGSGCYHPKDFRTARGTSLALELLGTRKRLPKSKAARKRIVNSALDRVAKMLGNTRAVSRSAYVDPSILERFFPEDVPQEPVKLFRATPL